jgi:predicted nucleic acid-binding protein
VLVRKFDRALAEGAAATCRAVVAELVRSARNAAELEERREKLDQLRDLPIRRRE